jgi:hypothetical protein
METMDETVHVTSAEVVGDRRLRLTFDDGAAGEIDAPGRRFDTVFEPLADPRFFAAVELDEASGTIAWANGADVAPDTLRAEIVVA